VTVAAVAVGRAGGDADDGMVGRHPLIAELRDQIGRAAAIDAPVVIEGETGVGKELVAQALHRRRGVAGQLVPINVTTLAEQLVDAALFGSVRGAYTGADRDRRGLIDEAAGGTLFLDEAADLPRLVQAKLLRTLDSGEIRSVGSTAVRHVRFRLVVSIQEPVAVLVQNGRWRDDFRYRVSAVVLRVPPLRERPGDIPELTAHFLESLGHPSLPPRSLIGLAQHTWPGNVRQLRRLVERVTFLRGRSLGADDLLAAADDMHAAADRASHPIRPEPVLTIAESEARHIAAVLESTDYDTGMAAKLLGLSRSGLYKKMTRLGVSRRSGGHGRMPR
jgi:DNA-binding NtrC family response regulator